MKTETFIARGRWGLCVLVFHSVAMLSVGAELEDPAKRSAALFDSTVLPLFEANCFECHSHSEEIRAGLALDAVSGLREGGHTGRAVVPGKPEESPLIWALRGERKLERMPKGSDALEPAMIRAVEEWIRLGAVDTRPEVAAPDTPDAEDGHWAFQPLEKPAIPEVVDDSWPRNAIDYFVLSKLEEQGMRPAKEADSRTLIRRLSFDLLGLPPEFATVERLEKRAVSDWYPGFVDETLASPFFGERWGRHWLDIARYADTKGYVFTSERRFPFSYTYRDYVISAFNDDKPYGQFILEQLAADQLDLGADKRALAGMGFLTLGRRFLNNQHDIIDDRIDVVTRGLMGLTVACARCHDHKYDPIPTEDYYSLYGVFASSREPDEAPILQGVDINPRDREAFEEELKKREGEYHAARVEKFDRAREKARQQTGAYLKAIYDARDLDDSERDSLARERKLSPEILNRWKRRLDDERDHEDSLMTPFLALVDSDGAPVSVAGFELPDLLATRLSAGDGSIVVDNALEAYSAYFEELFAKGPESGSDERVGRGLSFLYGENAPASVSDREAMRLLDVQDQQEIRRLKRELDALPATHPGAPPRAMALVDRENPVEPVVFVRGQASRPGKAVPRRFLGFISDGEREPFENGSGRLEMAEAIADPENPLTARVWVNRVWGRYFGAPLVQTPSDFGLRAPEPEHSELLDYLAVYLQENDGSLKRLSRLIVTSAAYRQSSVREDGGYLEADPENRYLWKMSRKRLEFEPMRDQMLAISGELDLRQGGRPVEITEPPFSNRRSVYGFIERQNLPALFRTFDFASPDTTSPKRFVTTVPQQALYMMNSPWAINRAKGLAQRVPAGSERVAIERLYQLVLSREPSAEEIRRSEAFLDGFDALSEPADGEASLSAIETLAQALLISNEALFVD